MGLMILLFFFARALEVGIVCGALATAATLRVHRGRVPAILSAGLLPAACLLWALVLIVAGTFLHVDLVRDFGLLGRNYQCALVNDYELTLPTPESTGYVHLRDLSPYDTVIQSGDVIVGVSKLEASGNYVLGKACAHGSVGCFPADTPFILDTLTRQRTDFASLDELKTAASRLGVKVQLEPAYRVYLRHRFSTFSWIAAVLFVLPTVAAWAMLIKWILRLRRQATLHAPQYQ